MNKPKIAQPEKEKFVLTKDDFLFLEKTLLDMGYLEETTTYSKRLFDRLNLVPPRTITGRESTYIYKSREQGNNYRVIIHTTYLKASNKWRDTSNDAAWCLIAEGDQAKYFARPFLRTKGLVLKLIRYAWVTKWKVDHRPLCPQCQDFMDIVKRVEPRGYYWICRNNVRHDENKPVFSPWDFGLPFKASKFVDIRREYTKKYNDKNKKEGKTPTPARKIRKSWIVKKPENLT